MNARTGLYDPAYEHDACGVAFVARLDARPSHETVERALTALANLEHRGAAGADARTGRRRRDPRADPGRVLPRRASTRSCRRPGSYGVAMCFLPHDDARRARARAAARRRRSTRRASASSAGATSRSTRRRPATRPAPSRPAIRQLFVAAAAWSRPGRLRAQALRDPPPRRARPPGPTSSIPSFSSRRSSTRGC